MSEKLDGVRCYWNGSTMYTRNGKLFYPPDWFKDLLPKDLALDGELWTKRDDFQRAVSIVRRQDKNDDWREISYMVYDAPLLTQKFSDRLKIIE
jgi:DNA ligase-1